MVIHVRLEYLFPEENGHGESDASVNVKVCGRSRDILTGVKSYTMNEQCQILFILQCLRQVLIYGPLI